MSATRTKAVTLIRGAGRVAPLAALGAAFSYLAPNFLTSANLLNVLRQMAEVSIIGVGMTALIVAGEFDLSVGSMYGFAAVLAAALVRDAGLNAWLAAALSLAVAGGVGLGNGLLTTGLRVPSFIITLGMLSVLRGAALVLSGGWPVAGLPSSSFYTALSGELFGWLPAQIPWMLAVNLAGGLALARTVFGFHIYATGGNPHAARLCGVGTGWVKIRCFIWVAMAAALAGLISLAHLGSATPLAGTGLELDVFAAVVIGGTRLSGGVGGVGGTFLGAAIMGVLRNGLVLMRVPAFWQEGLIGAIIILAVALDKLARWKEADAV